MSSNLNYKQAANVERRTWDTETYEKRAKDRAKNEDASGKKEGKKGPVELGEKRPADDEAESKEEFVPAAKGAVGPHKSKRAFLKARKGKVDVDSKIGSVEMVNPEAAATTKANIGEVGSIKVRNLHIVFSRQKVLLYRQNLNDDLSVLGRSDQDGHWMALQSL
jgi:hypothetical protein